MPLTIPTQSTAHRPTGRNFLLIHHAAHDKRHYGNPLQKSKECVCLQEAAEDIGETEETTLTSRLQKLLSWTEETKPFAHKASCFTILVKTAKSDQLMLL